MTKLELMRRLSEAGTKMSKLLDESTIDFDKLMKFKKAELEQFAKAYETINVMVSKCLVTKEEMCPCTKCTVSDKVACCGCKEYFEWREG